MSKSVAILMATYNGSRFLIEQLESIAAQESVLWSLIVSDDGSSDQTLTILREYQQRWPKERLIIRQGPRTGFCQNFLSMACDSQIKADFYAFCDQDDVWMPDKLSVAIEKIIGNQDDFAYVYCGRTIYVDKNLKKIGFSPLFSFPRTFRNALVQSIAGGNTMVFNQKVKDLLEKTGVVDHPSHDWWIYQLVTGVGGIVYYDPIPHILYRQHSYAIVGCNNSTSARIKRLIMIIQGRFKGWTDRNISILSNINSLLTHGNRESLDLFTLLRSAKLKDRFRLLEVAGLYRQTWPGTISLLIAALFKRI